MKKISILIIICFINLTLSAQEIRYIQDDTLEYFYSGTDFSKIDTIEYWVFNIDKFQESNKNDSINPVGRINFWRNIAIDDSISLKLYGKLWTPRISYDIYNKKDSLYCRNMSRRMRFFSSAIPPNVGGDYIVLGEYVLINIDGNYARYDTKIDYCRPLLNRVFTEISDVKTLKSLEFQVSKLIKKEENNR
ncbi:MAG: hypothetical protein MK105_18795 [Crocinitomicaceae bacterium]|nr:hypothetical protein [Crocinitomicaceae bacterium]